MLPGATVSSIFYVRDQTQAVVAPDSLPASILLRNGIDTTIAVSVSMLADGGYLAQAVIPTNWLDGDTVHLRFTATVQGLARIRAHKLGEIATLTLAQIEASTILAKEATAKAAKNAAIAGL